MQEQLKKKEEAEERERKRLDKEKEKAEKEKEKKKAAAAAASAAAGGSSSDTAVAGGSGSGAGPSSSKAAAAADGAGPSSSSSRPAATTFDPKVALEELNQAVVTIATRTEALWKALSSCISKIEEGLKHHGPAKGAQEAPPAAGSAAARLIPPGAQLMMPLVEAFFVLCSLEGAIPALPPQQKAADLLNAFSIESSVLQQVTGAGSSGSGGLLRAPSLAAVASQGSGGAGPSAARAGTAAAAAAAGGGGVPGPSMDRAASTLMELGPTTSSSSGSGQEVAAGVPFLKFAERHRRLLNAYLRRNSGLLETSLAPLVRVPKLIDFDNKRQYFRSKIRTHEERHYGSLRLSVRREHVFEDSFHQLRMRTPEEMRYKLQVQFTGEEGIDAGGVSREWYQVMAREIFNPNLALFVNVPEGGTTFQPNPNSIVQNDRGISHLDFFKFVGRLVGKALYDGQLIDAYFTRSFYKHMLGQPLTYEDIEGVDPEYYKNLAWMLANDITDVLDLTFTAESDFFGKTEVVELVPGGKNIKVTEANKREYVNLITRHRMTTSIKGQLQAFLQGFWDLVPQPLISLFNDHELELLISGLPEIDLGDLRRNTEYHGYSASSPVVVWFWQVVEEFDKQDQALLLQFATGTSKVPLEGFKALQGIGGPQKFQIHKAYGASEGRLPSAHTCFNQLDLPEYDSKEQLAERLAMAIHEGHEGFGFG